MRSLKDEDSRTLSGNEKPSVRIKWCSSGMLSALNGMVPVVRAYSSTPRLHTSAPKYLYPFLLMISGAM